MHRIRKELELVREEFNAHATAPKYSQISNHVKALRQATEALLAEQERMVRLCNTPNTGRKNDECNEFHRQLAPWLNPLLPRFDYTGAQINDFVTTAELIMRELPHFREMLRHIEKTLASVRGEKTPYKDVAGGPLMFAAWQCFHSFRALDGEPVPENDPGSVSRKRYKEYTEHVYYVATGTKDKGLSNQCDRVARYVRKATPYTLEFNVIRRELSGTTIGDNRRFVLTLRRYVIGGELCKLICEDPKAPLPFS